MDLKRTYWILIAFSVFCISFLLAACGPRVQRFYSADQLRNNDIAVIELRDGKIRSIDREGCLACFPSAFRNFEAHILPGQHTIVYAPVPTPIEGPVAYSLAVNIDKGKRYVLREHRLILRWEPFAYSTYRTYATADTIKCLSLQEATDVSNAVLYSPLDPKHLGTDAFISLYTEETDSPPPKAVLRMTPLSSVR